MGAPLFNNPAGSLCRSADESSLAALSEDSALVGALATLSDEGRHALQAASAQSLLRQMSWLRRQPQPLH